MFKYFQMGENEQYLFLQLPLLLIKDRKFKDLSGDAKILYSLLLNRTGLSRKNNWADEKGNVYIIYTIKEIKADLNCYEQKAVKCKKELEEIGLIKTVRQGQGKPTIIYVMNFADSENTTEESKKPIKPVSIKTCENHNSRLVKITNQELRKSQSSNINIIKTDIKSKSKSKSDRAASDSVPKKEKEKKTDMTLTHDIDMRAEEVFSGKEKSSPLGNDLPIDPARNNFPVNYRDIIQENISYGKYVDRPAQLDAVDEIINCMLDVICNEGKTVRINGEQKSRALVKSQYLKLNNLDIEHVISRYKAQTHKIKYPHAYLKAMLFTVQQERNHFNGNSANAHEFKDTGENSPVKSDKKWVSSPTPKKRNRFANFAPRERDFAEIERIEMEYLLRSVEGE